MPCERRHLLRTTRSGFTLVELLTVIALIAIFAGAIGLGLRGGRGSVGLEAGQSTLASLLTLARSEAAVSGVNAGVMVNTNSNNEDRYLRYLIPVRWSGSSWEELSDGTYLPEGCYIVPSSAPTGGMIEVGANWTGLESTALVDIDSQPLNSNVSESWSGVIFNPQGKVEFGSDGNVVIALGRKRPPPSDPSFTWINPESVRGVTLTIYGQVRTVNNREGF